MSKSQEPNKKKYECLSKVIDCLWTNDAHGAIQAIEKYAKLRAVQFSEWQDNTKSPTLHLEWETTKELYDIFTEYITD